MTVTVWLDLWRETVVVRRRFTPEPTGQTSPGAVSAATERYLAHCRWLNEAREHPIVQLVHTDDRQQILSTVFVGPATLATTRFQPHEAAQLLSSLAGALARLHADGLTHGNLCADHVPIRGNRLWLCSPSPQRGEPHTDVAALGTIVEELVSGWERSDQGPRLNSAARQRWQDLAMMTRDSAMSAARFARRADALS